MPYLLVINQLPSSVVQDFKDLPILLLTLQPKKYEQLDAVTVVACDLTSPQDITDKLTPYIDQIAGVFCTSDENIQYLQHILPLLPSRVLVATNEALTKSTNKRAMREAFATSHPDITPRFIRVQDASDATVTNIGKHISYPVIIKPASLASSMLIRVCRNVRELAAGLAETFTTIQAVYKREKRTIAPEVIVEEFLEGDLYSVDVYIADKGTVFFCPPVAYVTNKDRGVDDFSLYRRTVPTTLTDEQIVALNETARKAVDAVGLTYSSAHVELILTAAGWRVIELGPRVGRYRHKMYMHAYGINHYLNDIRIHLGKPPLIPTALTHYCAAYSIYPDKEGTLTQIQGLDFLQTNPAIASYNVRARIGEKCKFAKNGGKIVVEFYIVTSDKATFDKTIAYVESNVKAVTA